MSCKILKTKKEIQEFLDNFDYLVCDCDGVLWRGNVTFESVKETIEYLSKERDMKFLYQTNNSTSSRKDYVKKFEKKIGLKIDTEDIYPSSYLLAQYLKSVNFKKKAYVIGHEGIRQELELEGIESCGYGEHFRTKFIEQEFVDNIKLDPEIGCIVGSYDREFSNYKIAYAHAHFYNIPGCKYVATNADTSFPFSRSDGSTTILPGGGTYVAALTSCLHQEPVIVGKPSTFGLELILKKYGMKKERVCYIGDRLDTDILMANRVGVSSLMVMTGISTKEEVFEGRCPSDQIPKFMIEKFSDLLV